MLAILYMDMYMHVESAKLEQAELSVGNAMKGKSVTTNQTEMWKNDREKVYI